MAPGREQCPGCGFVWEDISPADVSPRIRAATHEFASVLADPRADTRPEPARWSVIEYGEHLRVDRVTYEALKAGL